MREQKRCEQNSPLFCSERILFSYILFSKALVSFSSFFVFVPERAKVRLSARALGIGSATMAICYLLFFFFRERVQCIIAVKEFASNPR